MISFKIQAFIKGINEIARNEKEDIVSAYEELIEEYNNKYPGIPWEWVFENISVGG